MNKLTRKLLISVFTLVFAAVTLGATTFAWFTLTTVAKIDPVDVDIEAGEGIELSLDGKTFKSFITADELKEVIGNSIVFKPLTTSDGKLLVDLGSEEGTANTDYVEFTIFVRTPVEDGKLVLLGGENQTKIWSEKKVWIADIDFDYDGDGNSENNVKASDVLEVYAANAIRMSFEEASNLEFTAAEVTGAVTVSAEFDNEEALVFELDPADSAGVNIRLDNEVKTYGLLDYYNKKVDKAEQLKVTDAALPENVYSQADFNTTFLADVSYTNTVGEVDDNMFYSAVTVRIWLEGWDPDSFDAILDSKAYVQLYFGITERITVSD